MLKGKIVNTIRIITDGKEATAKVLKHISSEDKILDYNRIIPLDDASESIKIEKWQQPNNAVIEAYKIDDKEILVKIRTLLIPPLKIMKHLSLFSDVEEIILSFANINMSAESGLFQIRRGGVMQKVSFEENSEETHDFSAKLIHQLEKPMENTVIIENVKD